MYLSEVNSSFAKAVRSAYARKRMEQSVMGMLGI
jgi:hypothetical protein